MAFSTDNGEHRRAEFSCSKCKDTGLTFEGTGHRMSAYPYAEKHSLTSCICAAGKRLDAQEGGFLARERAAQTAADDLMSKVTQ